MSNTSRYDHNTISDSFLREGSSTTPQGAGTLFLMGRESFGHLNPWIGVDLTGTPKEGTPVPLDANIVSATLDLFFTTIVTPSSILMSLKNLNVNFSYSELNMDWDNSDLFGSAWAGGVSEIAAGTIDEAFTPPAVTGLFSITVTEKVKFALTNQAGELSMLFQDAQSSGTDEWTFKSTKHATVIDRPLLTVIWDPATAPHELASGPVISPLGGLGAGGLHH